MVDLYPDREEDWICAGVQADIVQLIAATDPSLGVVSAVATVADYVFLQQDQPHCGIFVCDASFYDANNDRVGAPFVHIHRIADVTNASVPQSFN